MIGLFARLEAGLWSAGRPVFKKVDGEQRFLMVSKAGRTTWSIRNSLNSTGCGIQSGRSTNSPASPEAGPSVREGVTKWRYGDGSWIEGDISVTCKGRVALTDGLKILALPRLA